MLRSMSRCGVAVVAAGGARCPWRCRPRHIWQLQSSTRHVVATAVTAPSAVGFDDYEEACRTYKLDVPEHFNFTTDVIDKWAEIEDIEKEAAGEVEGDEPSREHLALWWTSEFLPDTILKWSFKQLSDYTRRAAYILTGPCALKKGDRVVSMLPVFPQYWILHLACIRVGVVLVPCSYHTAEAIKYRLQVSNAKCVITDEQTVDLVDEIVDECPLVQSKMFVPSSRAAITRKLGWFNYADMYKTSPGTFSVGVKTKSDDIMSIYFTTGTTGSPKMVPHTHAGYGLGHEITGKYFLDLVRSDVHWNLMKDTGWVKMSWSSLFGPWSQGACVFVHHTNDFSAESTLKTLETYPITTMCATPSHYRNLIQEDLANCQFQSLRHCVCSGELLNPEVIEKWREGTGLWIHEGYGQTETALLCGNFKCLPIKAGSMGKPVPGVDLRVIDADDNEMEVGEVGEIAVRLRPNWPVGVFAGYMGHTQKHKNKMVFSDEYYHTGDHGYKDSDGYFWFVSRDEDLIYTEGMAISPFDIESVILEHDAVAECAAVSSPDHIQLTGQVIKVFVVVADAFQNMDEEELLSLLFAHAAALLPREKIPKQFEFIDHLTKTSNGKVMRSKLRDREWHFLS